MSELTPPARVEFVLVYACPHCGKETLLRARDAGETVECKSCQRAFQPQPLAEVARLGMLDAFQRLQPPVPRPVKVVGLRGQCFSFLARSEDLRFTAVADIEALHALCHKGESARHVGQTLLVHGILREVSRPGDFAYAVLEGHGRQAEAFIEFADAAVELSSLREKSAVCIQGVFRGLMGSHNPLAIVFGDSVLVGAQGRLLPPGGACADAVLELPPRSERNPLDTHFIFQAPPQVVEPPLPQSRSAP